jgi:hypothetical protein
MTQCLELYKAVAHITKNGQLHKIQAQNKQPLVSFKFS